MINEQSSQENKSVNPSQDTTRYLSWSANRFIRTPTSAVFNLAVMFMVCIILICSLLARFIEIDISIQGNTEISPEAGIRDAIALADGFVTKLIKKTGDEVKENELIGIVASESAPAEEVEKAMINLKLLEKKVAEARESTTMIHDSLEFLIPAIIDSNLLQAMVNIQQSLRAFQEQRNRISSELETELIYANRRIDSVVKNLKKKNKTGGKGVAVEIHFTKERINVLTDKLAKMKASSHQELLQTYIETTEDELGKLKSTLARSIAQAQGAAAQEEDHMNEELGRLQAQVVSARNLARSKLNGAISELSNAFEIGRGVLANYVRQHEIRSPISGSIAKIISGQNSHVTINKVIASVVPTNSKIIGNINVASMDIAKLAVGQQVYYKVEAYPYQRFGLFTGQVTGFDQIKGDTSSNVEDTFIVKATITPPEELPEEIRKQVKFVAGMKAQADVVIDRKSIKDLFIEKFFFKMSM